ncbi:hypothetical protein VCRA2116O29_140106 [Vibrio crassostreae]|uniref:hypothetical protein n=1 Tax=Vibrio crassostreae TaxID=246167 RepID=UPI0010EB5185|nr:hypothetical protein [Vibrio crassostreae]TCN84426.1 hypothetical protein EDB37_1015105 [Vibrio crassostreae]CAK2409797.1 hypothetical protein VCRA2116O29_140106 [Vibrio crassostreae]CAK2414162.1 hypothetical protein VCRA2119O48_160001 [Vibrio crassostreae]CAK3610758.1 hypothetical protein VCRA2123O74_140105 [Vibrio crassostreae]CAK3796931.1 hypothetical protein VCRA212O16_160107 [Vibrio crassostreae]
MRNFNDYLIVRLPGLVGPGLKKNIIFDFLNKNNLDEIESRGVFQFYPMVNLWPDIQSAIRAGLNLIHLTSEPVSVKEIAKEAFGLTFNNEASGSPATYNFQTCHATQNRYQYSKKETLLAIRAYAQSEPKAEK